MIITNINLKKIDSVTNIRAVVSIVLDNSFAVTDIKVIENKKGLFVAMPSKRDNDGTFHDIAHPVNSDFRNYIQNAILEEYNKID